MFSECSKSFCRFLKKCFNKKNNTIKSQDLNQYLFADESNSFQNNKSSVLFSKDITILKFKNLNNHSENDYSPPNIKSCDSFISVNSDNSDSEIDSDDEPMQLNLKSDNPTSDNPTSDNPTLYNLKSDNPTSDEKYYL